MSDLRPAWLRWKEHLALDDGMVGQYMVSRQDLAELTLYAAGHEGEPVSDDNDPTPPDEAVDRDALKADGPFLAQAAAVNQATSAHSYTVTDLCDLAITCMQGGRDPLAIAWLSLAEAMMRR